jgi:YaiO family outer membrane protein
MEESLLYRKAVALNRLNRSDEAVQTLEFMLTRDPTNGDARSLLDYIETGPQPYRFSASYGYDRLTALTPWQEGSLSMSRQTRFGSVVGRFNYANRFETSGRQVEVEAYPGLVRGFYAYVNYGYSGGAVFPRHRVGAEVFSNPGKGFEFSGGFRYLRFSSDVWIYTGSAGKYFGNYFASLRPYITPGVTGTSVSGSFMLRRYFRDSDSYVGFSTGAGSAPDDALDRSDLERLDSFKFGGFGSLPVREGLYFSFSAGWSSEQLPQELKRNRLTLSTGVTKRF